MKRLLVRTFSSDENDRGGFDYAVIDIDERMAKDLAGKLVFFRAMQKSNPDLLEMTFRDNGVKFYREEFLPGFVRRLVTEGEEEEDVDPLGTKEAMNSFSSFGWCALPEHVAMPDPDDDTSPDAPCGFRYLVISENGFHWLAQPEHSSFDVQTDVLGQEVLSQVL